ncbi:pyridoxamine 5'-phosphate oxidase family protein [Nocardioides sp. MH1]|uniref:pyridoxamine 5'-phosphate oxidase family protein n=1 Tax=Nocardioides sp. MH1 TaxID=3242490 RepID=UPI003521E5E4
MKDHWFSSKLRDLTRDEALSLLHSQCVGRIAFADDSGPDVLPVNYMMSGEDVLIATSAYGAIARAATNGRVAFEVDELDGYTESGWSIVVRGRATREAPFVTSADKPRPWVDGVRTYVLRITPDVISGRRLIPS